MSKNTFVITGIIFGVAVLATAAMLLIPAAPVPSDNSAPAEQIESKPSDATPQMFDFGASTAENSASSSTPTAPSSAAQAMNTKERSIESIHDAMTTYSAEGVPTLQPFLSNPDSEIRYAAIEAMKQLGVPEAAAALRAAAKKASDPEERKTILEAAEFAELPSLIAPPEKK